MMSLLRPRNVFLHLLHLFVFLRYQKKDPKMLWYCFLLFQSSFGVLSFCWTSLFCCYYCENCPFWPRWSVIEMYIKIRKIHYMTTSFHLCHVCSTEFLGPPHEILTTQWVQRHGVGRQSPNYGPQKLPLWPVLTRGIVADGKMHLTRDTVYCLIGPSGVQVE